VRAISVGDYGFSRETLFLEDVIMKQRNGFVGIALLGTLIVLMAADAAQAQRRGRRNRGMDTGYYAGNQQPAMDSAMPGQDPSRYSYYPSGAARNSAQIQLRLPSPEAEVRFDGQNTQQKGTMRLFTTPPLDGTYSYQVTAVWQKDGQPITRDRTITVRPGASVMVDFTTDRGATNQ
jgi:uncharacterized protein (TIGR03000 family)